MENIPIILKTYKNINKFIIQYLFYKFSLKSDIYSQHLESVRIIQEEIQSEFQIEDEIYDQNLWDDINDQYEIMISTRQYIINYLENVNEVIEEEKLDQIKYFLFKVTYFCNQEMYDKQFSDQVPLRYLEYIEYMKSSIEKTSQQFINNKNLQPPKEIDYEDDQFNQQTFVSQIDMTQVKFDSFKLNEIPQINTSTFDQEFMQDFKDCLELIGQQQEIKKKRKDKETLYIYFFNQFCSQESKSDLIKKYDIKGMKFFDKYKFIEILCDSTIIEQLEEDEAMLYFYFYIGLNLIKSEYIIFNKEQKLIKLIERISSFSELKHKEGYIFLLKLLYDLESKNSYSIKEYDNGNIEFCETFELFKNWDKVDYQVSDTYVNKELLQLFIDSICSAIKLILLPEFALCYSIKEKLPYQPTNLFIGYIQQCVRGKRLYLKYPDQLEKHVQYWEHLSENIKITVNEESKRKHEKNKTLFIIEEDILCLKISQINHKMCKLLIDNSEKDVQPLVKTIEEFISLIDCTQYRNIYNTKQLYYSLKSLFIKDDHIMSVLSYLIKKSFEFRENDFEGQTYRNWILSLKQELMINRYITRDGKRIFTLQQVEVVFESLRSNFNEARRVFLDNTAGLDAKLFNFEEILRYYGFLQKKKYKVFKKNIEFYIQYIKLEQELQNNEKKVLYQECKIQKKFPLGQFELKLVTLNNSESKLVIKRILEDDLILKKYQKYHPDQTVNNENRKKQQNIVELNEQLLREASILLQIPSHENIIKLIDYQVSKYGTLELFYEYYEHGSLFDLIYNSKQQIEDKEKLSICKQIIKGVQHLQKYIIIHNDLKLSNILVHKDENNNIQIKIIDLGTSAFMIEKTNGFTESYKSKDLKESLYSDYYSLGLILITILYDNQFIKYYNGILCKCQKKENEKCPCQEEDVKEEQKKQKHCKKYIKKMLSQFKDLTSLKEKFSQTLFEKILNLFNDQPYLRPPLSELIKLFEIVIKHYDQKDLKIKTEEYSQEYDPQNSRKLSRKNIENQEASNITILLKSYKIALIGVFYNYFEDKQYEQGDSNKRKDTQKPIQQNNNNQQPPLNSKEDLETYFKKYKGEEYEFRLTKFIKLLKFDFRKYNIDLYKIVNLESNSFEIKDIIQILLINPEQLQQTFNAFLSVIQLDLNILTKIATSFLTDNGNNLLEVIKDDLQDIQKQFQKYDK